MKSYLILLLTFLIYTGSNAFAMAEENCAVDTLDPQIVELAQTGISMTGISEALWSCTKSFFVGAWSATGGSVLDTADCALHPIDCANSSIEGVKNTWKFLLDIEKNVTQMAVSIVNLTPQQKVDILCELIGSIGAPIAVAILTAGAASGLIAKTMAQMSQKLIKLAQILRRLPKVAPKKLARFTEDVLDKIDDLAAHGYDNMLKKTLDSCPL